MSYYKEVQHLMLIIIVVLRVCVAINNHQSQLIEEIKSEMTTKERQLHIVSTNILLHLLAPTHDLGNG